ncbi:hypothetical protein HPB48_014886 [Haemaphysalis longicornis]|uniref:Uncharacterized protein n=1 Tax=Haemaphysalis longicornis TaxID=44386 RepID=A0A9J6GBU4_HAELO|nr:hypothetical protein HPB48_014886 [Haemaphysalis longicornis]
MPPESPLIISANWYSTVVYRLRPDIVRGTYDKVFALCLLEELVKNMGAPQYSLLIYESTDAANEKQLAVKPCCFRISLNELGTTFTGLSTLKGSSAQQIAQCFLDFVTEVGLDFTRCLGIATGGWNVMVRKNNSVYANLRQRKENIVRVK